MALSNVMGVALGFIGHALISALGLSLLIAKSSAAFAVLQWAGIVYLLWLGFSNIKSGLNLHSVAVSVNDKVNNNPANGLVSNFFKGFLTNCLNPKIVLFYLSIFPQFVNPETALSDSLLLGAIHATVVSSWFIVIILLSQVCKRFLTNLKNARRLNFLSGSIFFAFSAMLAIDRV